MKGIIEDYYMIEDAKKMALDDNFEEEEFGILIYRDFPEQQEEQQPSQECQQTNIESEISPEIQPVIEQPAKPSQQSIFKSNARMLWEARNPKILAKVNDGQGSVLEIRKANNGGQFGFWDVSRDQLSYVHKKNDNTFEYKGIVLKGSRP